MDIGGRRSEGPRRADAVEKCRVKDTACLIKKRAQRDKLTGTILDSCDESSDGGLCNKAG